MSAAGRSAAQGAARADRQVVAVLERRGRFLAAVPLFGSSFTDGPRRRDEGARVVREERGSRGRAQRARAGDLVLVESDRRGSRVVRVIGRPEIARDALQALLLERGMGRGFTEEVQSEARAAAAAARESDGRRRDLRGLATFTVDPPGARDFDDAISAEMSDGATVRVWVHIADVAAHVPEGSALDREAQRRATSVYVPGAVEPMLPHALSSDACSLVPGADRRALTVELEMRGAEVVGAQFYRSLIRSDERLDYDRVDRIFAGSESAPAPWGAPLQAARMTASELALRRERSGALVVDSGEPEFSFDEHGNVERIDRREQTESHRLIEHLMIAANEAVADLLGRRGVPCLYRVHERPDPARVERLVEQLASLSIPTPATPDSMSPPQAAELVGEISRFVDREVRRTGHGRLALGSLVLRSLKQAYYSPRNVGHAGLHSSSYCHFTSPIRRYPDIVCHRALLSALGERERAPRAGALGELGAWCSERERDAMSTERDADDVARCFALEAELAEGGREQEFSGEVTGLISAGAFIAFGETPSEGGAPPYEGMLPVRRMSAPDRAVKASRGRREVRGGGSGGGRPGGPQAEREWWELNEQATMLVGERSGATLRLGDAMRVRVERVEALRGRVDLRSAG